MADGKRTQAMSRHHQPSQTNEPLRARFGSRLILSKTHSPPHPQAGCHHSPQSYRAIKYVNLRHRHNAPYSPGTRVSSVHIRNRYRYFDISLGKLRAAITKKEVAAKSRQESTYLILARCISDGKWRRLWYIPLPLPLPLLLPLTLRAAICHRAWVAKDHGAGGGKASLESANGSGGGRKACPHTHTHTQVPDHHEHAPLSRGRSGYQRKAD
ncbi:hypothetical protein BGZ61DRAFT_131733 [Ilyonectria robusta]|uniref:uncharacterized protein n=1 Tax=Ilyonectria robusta TaxID=1079257 RepID=UPI001E8D026C|nr:uncharacterized protein BGZ61DRAFT_131733 [Ilyonectria robusta]KAH8734898.1 hypothetical protein BGZ61DRAFT_131733 [Ilyonectria robusta]